MKIRDLSARTGAAERQIRYMIAEGFVPAPRGSRAQPDYGDDHLEAIRRYLRLRALGLPPAAIKVMGAEGPLTLPVADGLALSIEPRILCGPLDVPAVLDRIAALLAELPQESPDEPDVPEES